MNHHIHRICRSLASPTRRAGVLVARHAAVPAAAAATRAEPPRWTTLPPAPAPNRAIATSEPRIGVHSRGAGNWRQLMAGSGGSQGLPAMALAMASSAVMPWAAAESR